MRNVLLACALALSTSVGCSSSYVPGDYATVGYRAPSQGTTAAAPTRGRLRGEGAASRRAAARRRTAASAPTTSPVLTARSASADAVGSRAEAAARADGAAQ